MLSELNAPVLETSSHLCCDRSCRDRGLRDSSMFKKSQSNFKSTEGAKYHFSLPLFIFLMSSTSRPLCMYSMWPLDRTKKTRTCISYHRRTVAN